MNPAISPPSDNLYKFLAVTGLIVLVGSFVYPIHQRKEFEQQSARYDGDYNVLEAERRLAHEAQQAEVKAVHAHGKELLQLLEEVKKHGAAKVVIPPHLQKEMELLDSVMAERRKKKAAIVLKAKGLETRRSELILTQRFLNRLDYWAAWVGVAGFGFTLLGFWRWGSSQRVQDKVQLKGLEEGEDAKGQEGRIKLEVPYSEAAEPKDRRWRWLYWGGLAGFVIGWVGLSGVHVARVSGLSGVEKAILDGDAARQEATRLMDRLLQDEMESDDLDDLKMREGVADAERMKPQDLIEAVERWGESDERAVPLKGLFLRMYAERYREWELRNRYVAREQFAMVGYGIGAALLAVGIGSLMLRSRLMSRS